MATLPTPRRVEVGRSVIIPREGEKYTMVIYQETSVEVHRDYDDQTPYDEERPGDFTTISTEEYCVVFFNDEEEEAKQAAQIEEQNQRIRESNAEAVRLYEEQVEANKKRFEEASAAGREVYLPRIYPPRIQEELSPKPNRAPDPGEMDVLPEDNGDGTVTRSLRRPNFNPRVEFRAKQWQDWG